MEEELLTLYANTAKQAARMQMYVIRAQRDNRPELVQLFNALDFSYTTQANRIMFQVRGFIGSSDENLTTAMDEELVAIIEQHESMKARGKQEGNKAITTGSEQAIKINKLNINLLKQAEKGRKADTFHICDFCGFVSMDTLPLLCPICTAQPYRFKQVSE